MNEVKVVQVNTELEFDPYTGQPSAFSFWLDPQKRRCGITSDYNTSGMDASDYHRRTFNERMSVVPDEVAARDYLTSEQGQALLRAICDGHSIGWDGRNMVGGLTEEAEDALGMVLESLNDLPESDWQLWNAGDWFSGTPEDVAPDATDEELDRMASALEAEARADHIVVVGIREYLAVRRDY